jgi:hypothetical protein
VTSLQKENQKQKELITELKQVHQIEQQALSQSL